MKKVTLILSVVLMVILLLQIGLMFMPYIALTAPVTTQNPNPGPMDYSLFDFCFMNTTPMVYQLEIIQGPKVWDTNANVTGFVLVFACAAISFFCSLFSRKAIVTHVFSVLYAVFAVHTFLASPFLSMCSYTMVNTLSLYVAIAGAAVVLVRTVTWVFARYIRKEYSLFES